MTTELEQLIEEQARDDRYGHRVFSPTLDDGLVVALSDRLDVLEPVETAFLLGAERKVQKSDRRTSRLHYLSRVQVEEAWRLHHGGLSTRELGRRLWKRYGYASPKSCSNSLSKLFRKHGLRARDRIEMTRMAHLTHGLYSQEKLGTPESKRLINDRQNRRRAKTSRQCEAVTRNGCRCARRFRGGGALCSLHTPEGRAAAAEQLRMMRLAQKVMPSGAPAVLTIGVGGAVSPARDPRG